MPDEILEEQTDSELLNDEEELEVPDVPDEDVQESEDRKDEEDEQDKDKKEDKIDEDKPFPYERPSISEIKAKYPNFFKDFPTFRDSIFREVEYTKIYPTVEDAREALDDSQALEGLRESVLAGKTEDIFDAISQTDTKAAEKFALNFLPTIYAKNVGLYTQVITPVLEVLVRNLASSRDENTRNASLVIGEYLWGKDGEGIVKGEKTFRRNLEDSPEEKKLKEERGKFQTEQYTGFRSNVLGDLTSQRRAVILRGLDPDKSMTDSQKEMLVERIEKLVDQALASDSQHMSVMNARWLRSKKEGFNSTSKEKIISAYLSRAKQVIPSIRQKERDAFLGTRKKASENRVREIEGKSSSTKEVTSGRVSSSNGNKTVLKPGRELYRKMSDIDILNAN